MGQSRLLAPAGEDMRLPVAHMVRLTHPRAEPDSDILPTLSKQRELYAVDKFACSC